MPDVAAAVVLCMHLAPDAVTANCLKQNLEWQFHHSTPAWPVTFGVNTPTGRPLRLQAVVSDVPSCGGVAYAAQHGIPTLTYPASKKGLFPGLTPRSWCSS